MDWRSLLAIPLYVVASRFPTLRNISGLSSDYCLLYLTAVSFERWQSASSTFDLLFSMAIGVDTSGRKPRITKNTPLYTFRNKVSLSVIGVGICFGLFMRYFQ